MYSPPNRTYTSPCIRLSMVIISLISSMNFAVTTFAYCDCFSSSGNHEFFPFMLAFQIFQLTDMNHAQVVRSTTIFTLTGFQTFHKARPLHTAITGKVVRIINTSVLSSAKPSMIKFSFMLFPLVVLILHDKDFIPCVRVYYLPDS